MPENNTPKYANLTEESEKSISVDKAAVESSLNNDPVSAGDDLLAAFNDMRSALREGRVTEAGVRRIAAINDINVDEMMRFANMSRLDMEKDPYYKSDLSDTGFTDHVNVDGHNKYFYPAKEGDVVEYNDVKLTRTGEHTIKCESDYLGNFEYDDNEYKVVFKEIKEDDGSTSYLPVLRYEGPDEYGFQTENAIQDYAEDVVSDADDDWNNGHYIRGALKFAWGGTTAVAALPGNLVNGVASGFDDNQTIGFDTCKIPDGVKCLDYTFAGRDNLQHFPRSIPSSVTSMHATFKGCSRMTVDSRFYEDQKIKLPDGLEDMSLTFKDCENLQAEYTGFDNEDQIPSTVVNLTECWSGCESMSGGKIRANDERGYRNFFLSRAGSAEGLMGVTSSTVNYSLPNFGGELTPYLSAALARGCLDNISGCTDKEAVKAYADNMQFMTDYTGKISEAFKEKAKELDQEKLDKTQTAATLYYQGDSHLGSIMSHAELASGGARMNNKILDENGNFTYDKTGLKCSTQEIPPDERSSALEKIIMYGGTFAALSGLSGSVTKNKYAALGMGAAGTLALSSAFPSMYESMYPVLNFTRNHLPDGKIKAALTAFIDKNCPCAEVSALNEEIKRKNKFWDDDYNVAMAFISGKDVEGNALVYADQKTERKAVSPLTDIFDRAANMAVMWDEKELDTLMKNSARSCQDTKTFLALATYMDPNTDTFEDCTKPVNESITKATDSMEEYWNKCKEEGTYDDATIRADMREYYSTMFHAIDVYNTSAKVAINDAHDIISKENRLEKHGLAMVNEAYTNTLMDSLKEMDAKYHFMDDETWTKIGHTNLEGASYSPIDHSISYTVPDTYAHDMNEFLEERYGKKYREEHGMVEPDIQTDSKNDSSAEAVSRTEIEQHEDIVSDDASFDIEATKDAVDSDVDF